MAELCFGLLLPNQICKQSFRCRWQSCSLGCCFYQIRFANPNQKLKHIIVEGHHQLQTLRILNLHLRILIVSKPTNQKLSFWILSSHPSVSSSGIIIFRFNDSRSESSGFSVFTSLLQLVHTIWDPNWILSIMDNELDIVNCTINNIALIIAKCAVFCFYNKKITVSKSDLAALLTRRAPINILDSKIYQRC